MRVMFEAAVPPNETVVAPVKPLPTIVTDVPPSVEPASFPTKRMGPGQPLGRLNCTLLEENQKSNDRGWLDKLKVRIPPEQSGKI